MQVDLANKEQPLDNSSSVTHKDKRPPNISISKVISPNSKWKQCKIMGKNISIRSYGAACPFQKTIYLYGGYQIMNGSLHDFYSISLDEAEDTFRWEPIIPKNQVSPGIRSKHALVAGSSKIYLIGGLSVNNDANGDLYEFDPKTNEWHLLHPEGAKIPPIQSFGAIVVNVGGEEKIIIAFGFDENKASATNAVYEYNISKNKMSLLFPGTEQGNETTPIPRTGCAVASDNTNIYIFGGKSQSTRFNDIWAFSLTDYKFSRLKDDGEIPFVRNGHSMNYFDGKLYVFGGIHDVTWQLDDLHIYDVKQQRWTTLEQDSPRKVEKKIQTINNQKQKADKSASKKKGWYDNASNMLNKNNSPAATSRQNFSLTYIEGQGNRGSQSPGKMLDEQRKKAFYLKKAQMLKNFEISKQEQEKLISLETSSQAMKISLDVIGNPDPKIKVPDDKLTDFGKESVSKFLEPLQNNSNVVVGKKPCARDGHCSVILGGELVIFCGDRHQMSFNDIYKLNLEMAIKQLHH